MDPIYVTGHRNPDTDSIVAAIAYAALRNACGDREYEAACLGQISEETQMVLDRFGRDVILVPDGEEYFTLSLPLVVSPQFFGWLFGLEDNVELLGPPEAVEGYRRSLAKVAALYEK